MPRLVAVTLLALGALGCAALRPALGLCHDGITQGQQAEATAAREFVRRYRVGTLGPRLTVSHAAKSVTFPKPMCPRGGPPKA